DRAVFDARPLGLAHGQPAAIGIEPPREHPLGLVLLRRNETDDVFGQALGSLLGFDQRLESILVLIDVDTADLFHRLLHLRHSSLRCGFKDRGLDRSVYGRFCCGSPSRCAQAAMPLALLSSAADTLIQASRNRSTSLSVVVGPRLTRTAPCPSSAGTPMAARTCEGATLPDEQAAPEDTATPARSKAITAVSAFMPGAENSVVLGSRSAASPKTTTAGVACRRPASSRSRRARIR